jgi:phage baseplate assembly protein V
MDNEILLAIQDLYRRLNNTLRPGVISEVDHDKARVRVRLGEKLSTTWLSYFAKRAGNTIDWDPPEVGEQCLVLAPGGELSGGFALTGLYSKANPAPANVGTKTLRRYADGLECAYDHKSHTLEISRPKELIVRVKGTRIDFQTDKAAIKNAAGDEVIALVSKGFRSVAGSQTVTMMGGQPLLPAAKDLPEIAAKLESFGGLDATP